MNSEDQDPILDDTPGVETLTEEEKLFLEQNVGTALENGRELYDWWRRTDRSNGYRNRFTVARELDSPNENFGFLENVPMRKGELAVEGVVQDMLYDRPRVADSSQDERLLEQLVEQLQAFALHYFMRVSSQPQPLKRGKSASADARFQGWAYKQLFYRRTDGSVGKFPKDEQARIIDLRCLKDPRDPKIADKRSQYYEWIVLRVRLFNFKMTVRLFGPDGPRLNLPVSEEVYTVLPWFMVRNERLQKPVDAPPSTASASYHTFRKKHALGRFGYGYFVVHRSDPGSPLYGPSKLSAAFETIHFEVLDDGEVRAKMVFVANQPNRIIDIDPVEMGFNMANMATLGAASPLLEPMKVTLDKLVPKFDPVFEAIRFANILTGGVARDHLAISKERLLKNIMVLHFQQAYDFFLNTSSTWRLVPDWKNAKQSLEEWTARASSSD